MYTSTSSPHEFGTRGREQVVQRCQAERAPLPQSRASGPCSTPTAGTPAPSTRSTGASQTWQTAPRFLPAWMPAPGMMAMRPSAAARAYRRTASLSAAVVRPPASGTVHLRIGATSSLRFFGHSSLSLKLSDRQPLP